jgi:adenine/guanine phosphoribosyltransferase-like PRPP-binding protein
VNSTSILVDRLKAVALLRIARKQFKYADLSKITGIDEPTLNRYVHGILVPNLQRAHQIVEVLQPRTDIAGEVRILLKEKITTYPDASSIFIQNPAIPAWISYYIHDRYAKLRVDTLLSVEDGGILISSIAAILLDARLLFAARDREHYAGKTVEQHYWPYRASDGELANPRLMRILSLPDGYIQKHNRVLLLDDIVWSGETMRALGRFVAASKGEVVGAFCLGVFVKDVLKDLERDLGCGLDYITELNPSTRAKT